MVLFLNGFVIFVFVQMLQSIDLTCPDCIRKDLQKGLFIRDTRANSISSSTAPAYNLVTHVAVCPFRHEYDSDAMLSTYVC